MCNLPKDDCPSDLEEIRRVGMEVFHKLHWPEECPSHPLKRFDVVLNFSFGFHPDPVSRTVSKEGDETHEAIPVSSVSPTSPEEYTMCFTPNA